MKRLFHILKHWRAYWYFRGGRSERLHERAILHAQGKIVAMPQTND